MPDAGIGPGGSAADSCPLYERNIISTRMRQRFQIIVSGKTPSGELGPAPPRGFWSRFKLLLAGLAVAVLAIAVLVAALILGSVIAVVVAAVLMIAVAIVIVKTALMRAKARKG